MIKEDFKSHLEFVWSQTLKELDIEFLYEPHKIVILDGEEEIKYIPDFYLPKQDLYIEVKGGHKREGSSMVKPRVLVEHGARVIKATSTGKFNFIDNKSTDCFLLKCKTCNNIIFSTYSNTTCDCGFDKYDSLNIFSGCGKNMEIIHSGSEGIKPWAYIPSQKNWLFSKLEFDKISNTLPEHTLQIFQNIYEKLAGNYISNEFTDDKISKLKILFAKYPNMKEFEEFVFGIIDTLVLRNDKSIKLPPVILLGSPGCGKTSFSKEFSDICCPGNYKKVELGNSIASFSLIGSDKGFTNSGPGIILESMYSNEFAPCSNPIIILDEFEKVKVSTHSAENVFNSILEKQNSKDFVDNFFGIPIDASNINYLGICNTLEGITPSVLNRFTVFSIRDYTEKEIIDVVIPNVYPQWIKEEHLKKDCIPKKLSLDIRKKVARRSDSIIRNIKGSLLYYLNETKIVEKKTKKTISLFSKRELRKWRKYVGEIEQKHERISELRIKNYKILDIDDLKDNELYKKKLR